MINFLIRIVALLTAITVGLTLVPAASANSYVTIAAIYWDGTSLRDWRAVVPSNLVGSITNNLAEIPSVLAAGEVGRRGILENSVPVERNRDPRRSEQWALDRLDYGKYAADGNGVIVAVIDTGVDATHPDLAGKVLPGFDVYSSTTLGKYDPNGHGTHVAGIIAATADNATGVAGLAPSVKILPVRVLDETGYGDDSLVAKGVLWAVLNGAQVINLSLGGPDRDPLLAEAIDKAVAAGVAVVVAAGNEGISGSPVSYPGAHPDVTAVAATSSNDQRALFSTVGQFVDVAAPGMSILSTWPSGYSYQSGTSMATPFVSAATALVISDLKLSPRQALARVVSSATDIDAPGLDSNSGAGLIDPLAALGDGRSRSIEARGKIVVTPMPNFPELALPRLQLPLLPPLTKPILPPLPALTLPKLELPKYNAPLFPNPENTQMPINPLVPIKPHNPLTPEIPSQNRANPQYGNEATPPVRAEPKVINKFEKKVPVILSVQVVSIKGGSIIRIGLRSNNGPLVNRELMINSKGKPLILTTNALGFVQFRTTVVKGTVLFNGDKTYSKKLITWQLK